MIVTKEICFPIFLFFFRRAAFIYRVTRLINVSSLSFSFLYFIDLVLFFATTNLCAWFILCECISLFHFILIPLYMSCYLSKLTLQFTEHGEGLQVLHYEVGQKYDAHYDYFLDEFNTKNGGQRIATVLMYL